MLTLSSFLSAADSERNAHCILSHIRGIVVQEITRIMRRTTKFKMAVCS
jgi:hypothetical protein